MTERLTPSRIRTDGGTQARAKLDNDTVVEYADAMRRGDQFPAVIVFYDGTDHWLADGFHRLAAHRQAFGSGGYITADIRQGTRRDAVLFAAGANASHGLRRSTEDKKRAVVALLSDEEWGTWSDREIARRCQVSHPFVAKLREEAVTLTGNISSERVYVNRHGSISTMDTEAIARAAERKAARGGLTKAEFVDSLAPQLSVFFYEYEDEHGRDWRAIQDVAAHSNSIPWRKITKWLDDQGIYYEDDCLKDAIKLALAEMPEASAVFAEEDRYLSLRDEDGRHPPVECPRCWSQEHTQLVGRDHWRCSNCGREFDCIGNPKIAAKSAAIKAAIVDFEDSKDGWPELKDETFTSPIHHLRSATSHGKSFIEQIKNRRPSLANTPEDDFYEAARDLYGERIEAASDKAQIAQTHQRRLPETNSRVRKLETIQKLLEEIIIAAELPKEADVVFAVNRAIQHVQVAIVTAKAYVKPVMDTE